MALDGNRLGTAIFNAINSISIPQDSEVSNATLENIYKAMGTAIVNEIISNAQVTTTTSSTGTATGVTPGAGVAPTISIGTGTGGIL